MFSIVSSPSRSRVEESPVRRGRKNFGIEERDYLERTVIKGFKAQARGSAAEELNEDIGRHL